MWESVVEYFKKLFSSVEEREIYDTVVQVKLEGSKEIQEINKSYETLGVVHTNAINDLQTILHDQRELEVQKKSAEVKARVQQRIIDVKKNQLKRKEEEKKEKIAQIKQWLEKL